MTKQEIRGLLVRYVGVTGKPPKEVRMNEAMAANFTKQEQKKLNIIIVPELPDDKIVVE